MHDPSTIVKCGQEYWLFATGPGVASWRSKDLNHWERAPRVFATPPTWITNIVGDQRGYFWAPDVIYHNGRYWVYYSVSKFGLNTSAIALASNPTLEPNDPSFKWTDHGPVIESRKGDNFNAIDPALIKTSDGALWMSFGSFWSGIKLIELDPATGKRRGTNSPMHSLAHTEAIEAPFIYRREGFYYLFVNWDRCCRGTNSTYNIRVGRGQKVTGPYLDREAKTWPPGVARWFSAVTVPSLVPVTPGSSKRTVNPGSVVTFTMGPTAVLPSSPFGQCAGPRMVGP